MSEEQGLSSLPKGVSYILFSLHAFFSHFSCTMLDCGKYISVSVIEHINATDSSLEPGSP